jgi:hypothetical protein
LDDIPTSWLDSLLTGPNAALHGDGGTWGCPDIERLLKRIKERMTKTANSIIHPNPADRPGLRFWVSWRNLYAGNHPCQSFTGKGLDQVWPVIHGRQWAFVACHIGAIKDKVGLSLAKPIYE